MSPSQPSPRASATTQRPPSAAHSAGDTACPLRGGGATHTSNRCRKPRLVEQSPLATCSGARAIMGSLGLCALGLRWHRALVRSAHLGAISRAELAMRAGTFRLRVLAFSPLAACEPLELRLRA